MIRRLSLFCFFIFLSAWTFGQNGSESYKVIYDYNTDWLSFDEESGMYLPYMANPNRIGKYLYSLRVNLDDFPHTYLIIDLPEAETEIFLEEKLIKAFAKAGPVRFSMDSLSRRYKARDVLFTFLSTAGPGDMKVMAGYPFDSITKEVSAGRNREVVKLLPKVGIKRNVVAIVFLFSIMISGIISGNFIRAYGEYYSARQFLSTNVKDILFLIGKPTDRPNILFVLLLSVIIASILSILFSADIEQVKHFEFYKDISSFRSFIVFYFVSIILIFSAFLVKYFFIKILSSLFNLKSVLDAHYFKIIQFSLYVFTAIFLLLIILFNLHIDMSFLMGDFLFISTILFFLLRFVIIYFTLNKEKHTRFLYLFSYLCIAEVLPVALYFGVLF